MSNIIMIVALILLCAVIITSFFVLKSGKFKKNKYKEYFKIVNKIITVILAIIGTLGISAVIYLSINAENVGILTLFTDNFSGTIIDEATIKGNGNAIGNNNKITNTYISSNDPQHDQLVAGKQYVDNENYEMAFKTFNSEELKYNEFAQINTAYLYAHGLGVEEDIPKAMEIYDGVDTDEAKRNKLGVLIASNDQGSNNEEIRELIHYFIEKDDDCVWNFLAYSCVGKGIDEMLQEDSSFKQFFSYDLSDLYNLSNWDIESGKYTNPPRNTTYIKYVFVGADFAYNTHEPQSLPYFYYDAYQLKYLELIDQIWT